MAGRTRRTAALACAAAAALGLVTGPAAAAAPLPRQPAARTAEPVGAAGAGGATRPAGVAEAARAAQAAGAARDAARDVAALRAELRRALDREEQALLGLGAGVQAGIAAEQREHAAAAGQAAAAAQQTRAVRDLYVAGGPLAVWSSLLTSGSPQELLQRRDAAGRLLDALDGSARRARDRHDGAAAAARRADGAADVAAGTVADVEAAGHRVAAALAAADARGRELTAVAAVGDRAHRAAVRQAARELADARREAARRRAEATRRAVALAGSGGSGTPGAAGVPAGWAALYRQAAAARCPGMRWTLLAAVGQVESRHGADPGPSSAGALGPMQFMPATFAAHGVDGDGDGTADPWQPADAVHSAAGYLCGGGAGEGTADGDRRALLRYNRADWYVDLVLGVEAGLRAAERRTATP